MKRFLLLGAAAATLLTAQAREVSPQEALQRLTDASVPMQAPGMGQTQGATLVFTETTPQQGSPAVYVFNKPDNAGFLVLPADDDAMPLLGYAQTGAFNAQAMPPQLASWLQGYAREIEWAREHPATLSFNPNRSNSYQADWQPIAPICQTKWDQDAPYWNDCPTTDGGARCYTGCVATAMAQVMKVYNYPEQPTGSVSYTDSKGVRRSMTFSGLTFDWANMLNTYRGSSYTEEQGAAVALLMKACGYAAHMNYSPDGSGAQETDGVAGMKQYFGYSQNAQVLDRDYFPLDQWEQMLYKNLQEGCPILYTGFTGDWSGHAFVIDGYSTDGFFHLNWGWSGAYDGYFRVYALNPEGYGSGGAAGGYNTMQSAALGLQPADQSTYEPIECSMVQNGSLKGSISGTRLTLRTTGGRPAYLFCNKGRTARFDFAASLTNASGEATIITITTGENLATDRGISEKAFSLPSNLPNGTYKVSTLYRKNGTSDWLSPLPQVGCTAYILLTKNGTNDFTVADPEVPLPVASDPQFTNFFVGRKTSISVNVSNPADGIEFLNSIVVGLFSNSSNPEQVGQLTDIQTIDLAAGTSQVVNFRGYFVDMDKKKVTTGNYLMGFFDEDTGESLGDELYPITIAANPGYATLKLNNFAVIGDAAGVGADDLAFTATVTCTKGFYDDVLTVAVFDASGQTNMGQTSCAPLSLPKGQSATVTIDVPISGAAPGNYIAALYWVKSTSISSNTLQLGAPISFVIVDQSAVSEIEADQAADALQPVYTIDGRLARAAGSDAPLAPGFYIRAGQKFIVR